MSYGYILILSDDMIHPEFGTEDITGLWAVASCGERELGSSEASIPEDRCYLFRWRQGADRQGKTFKTD